MKEFFKITSYICFASLYVYMIFQISFKPNTSFGEWLLDYLLVFGIANLFVKIVEYVWD